MDFLEKIPNLKKHVHHSYFSSFISQPLEVFNVEKDDIGSFLVNSYNQMKELKNRKRSLLAYSLTSKKNPCS